MNFQALLNESTAQLTHISSTPRLDAELLLTKVLNSSREYLYTYPERQLTFTQQEHFQNLLSQRKLAKPIPYILEHQAFWTLDLTVTSAVLIPRPETELLVEIALQKLSTQAITLLDLGTGSGAIALALAYERPQWSIVASDNSKAALQVAQQNAQRLNLNKIKFYQSDWFENLPKQKFNVIVSNPPYIPKNDPCLSQKDLQFEPQMALVAGADGLAAIRQIVQQTKEYLAADGWLMLEHGYNQSAAVSHLLTQNGFTNIETYADLAGHPRMTCAKM